MASNQYAFLNLPQTSSNKNGDTLFKISLDELDIGLMPLNRLMDKYKGDKTKPIWKLDTNLKTLKEYSAAADQYVSLQVTAEEVENSCIDTHKIVETQHCHLCDIEIPLIYTKNHLESPSHQHQQTLANHTLDKVKRQLDKPLTLNSNQPPSDLYYCTECNTVLYEHSKSAHTSTDEHILCARKEEALSKLVQVHTGIKRAHKIAAKNTEKKKHSIIEMVDQDTVKVTASNGDVVTVSKDNWLGIQRSHNYFRCRLCLIKGDLEDLNLHLSRQKHKERQSIELKDCHSNRKICQPGDETWYHCVICNITHYDQTNHVQQNNHQLNLRVAIAAAVPKQNTTETKQNIPKIQRLNDDAAKDSFVKTPITKNNAGLNKNADKKTLVKTALTNNIADGLNKESAKDSSVKTPMTNNNARTQNKSVQEPIIKTFDGDLLIQLNRNESLNVSRGNWHDLFFTDNFVICRLCLERFPLTLSNLCDHVEEYRHLRLVDHKMYIIKCIFVNSAEDLENLIAYEIETSSSLREELDFMNTDAETISFILDMEKLMKVPASNGKAFFVSKQNYHGIHLSRSRRNFDYEECYSCKVCGLCFPGGISSVKDHIKSKQHLKFAQTPIDYITGFRKMSIHLHCITCNSMVHNPEAHLTIAIHSKYRLKHDEVARSSIVK